jgi:hypothetical protein
MNNTKRWFSIAIGSTLAVLLLVGALTVIPALAQDPDGMMGGGMMDGSGFNGGFFGAGPGSMMGATQDFTGTTPFGFAPGWMMGNPQDGSGTTRFGPGWMMGGMINGMMGQMMNGMMGGGMMFNSNSPFFNVEPLTLAETEETLNAYLASLDDSNLEVDDIMIFDNHAYAQIVEKDSGIGVMEVLVDPTTKAVFPEMGPNMMWNQEYGMMSGFGNYGMKDMMMGGFGNNMMGNFGSADVSAEMTLSPEQAIEAAQTYLETSFSETGLTADEHADPFYGYYTLHVNQDGKTVGMLSVNGYTGQVFPHTWHGQLLEMSGE